MMIRKYRTYKNPKWMPVLNCFGVLTFLWGICPHDTHLQRIFFSMPLIAITTLWIMLVFPLCMAIDLSQRGKS